MTFSRHLTANDAPADHSVAMTTLHDLLWNLTVDELKLRLSLLDSNAASQRKADLVDAIKGALTGGALRREWDRLTCLEQAAVAETCYAPCLIYQEERVEAKYGKRPQFSKPSDNGRTTSRWDRGEPTRLLLFLYFGRTTRRYEIASDLAEALCHFVPQPPALKVAKMADLPEEDGLLIRLTEGDALAEVTALLRLAEQGNLGATAKTGMPTAAGRKSILECLRGGDFFPPEIAHPPSPRTWQQIIGDIKPVGWVRLLQSAGYLDSGKPKSKLTAAGIKALAKTPADIVRHLWKAWLTKSKFDEFHRVDEIKGQNSKGHMTAKPPRRQAIVDALVECPPSEWIDLQKFSSFMQAEGFDFEVSRDPWKLYLCDREYGNFGYDGYGGWNVVELRYLQVFLFEYAATLGLIDLAFVSPTDALPNYRDQWGADDLEWLSRYDGLRAFRITDLGAYCFGMKQGFEAAKPESSLRVAFSPDLTMRLLSSPLQPADRLLLETWAEEVTPGLWRLDSLRARDAIERGQIIEDFGEILRKADENFLPETVEGFFKTAQRDATAVQSLGEAMLFDCRDATTAAMIVEKKALSKLCHRCGESQLVVLAANLAKFQKQVRLLGLGIV